MTDNNALAQDLEGFIDNGGHMKGLGDLTLLRKCVAALRCQPATASGEVGELVTKLRRNCKNPKGGRKPSPRELEAADMLERLAAVVSHEIGSDDTQADLPIVGETQHSEAHVERVAEAIDQWIGDIRASREMARAAIAAMKGTSDD